MGDTVNVTIALERDLLRQAKVIAARYDTSVNALLRNYLAHLTELGVVEHRPAGGNVETLFRFSMGLMPRNAAMRSLGVSDYGLLIRLMNAAGLPLPSVPIQSRKAMVDTFLKAMRSHA